MVRSSISLFLATQRVVVTQLIVLCNASRDITMRCTGAVNGLRHFRYNTLVLGRLAAR